jgi:hypothetical protein
MTTAMEAYARGVKPHVLSDPGDAGALDAAHSYAVNLVSGGAETRTLAAPAFEGQVIQMNFQTDGGAITLTVASTLNQAGNNTALFEDAGDILALVAGRNGNALEWKVLLNDGATLSTV